ncbi:hypothetical protein PGTUg99_025320 [Puccinia graminis f. sp. tritici]|uniref:Uncharacterized protein n=1 Tax=Puccinia graminis f. sp. tritici TaxID=56615 RepID=A0A5B0MVA2_PUCGR|nr:hypothetical protein PGTUg99_025320 [Puccinia graminis f. sp. tritici]
MKPRKLNQETRSRMPRFFLLWGIIFLHPKPRDDEGEQYKTLFSYARERSNSYFFSSLSTCVIYLHPESKYQSLDNHRKVKGVDLLYPAGTRTRPQYQAVTVGLKSG